ncbi:MAG: putative secreted protein [Lachnospiraceae bacterium]|jgi:hypothetical protein|nr:putative secreted protein [Lachnospiraceae bacterium]
MKKKNTLFIMIAIIILAIAGCSKKGSEDIESESVSVAPTENTTEMAETTAETENHDNEVKSKLTGLWVPKEVGNKRPFAIILNNLELASPQSGIAEADVLYEAIVEGGITRFLGVFETLNDTRIGSVRSARHYFVSFADEYDAIFVHYGETTYATKKIAELGVDNLSGLTGIAETVFYRDKSIKAPHNAFASDAGIREGAGIKGYRLEYEEDYDGHFSFYEDDTDIVSNKDVEKINLNFTNYASPYFTYNEDDKLFYRYQFGTEHNDFNTGEQLAFKNIIVQFVKEWDIDKNDYQTMDIEDATGTGYYITNGKLVEITWTKNEASREMHYYDSKGNELRMNPGKTYIAIFPDNQVEDVVISD